MERENWNQISFDKKYVKGVITKKEDKLVVEGEIKNKISKNHFVTYWAADPADELQSYTGTYLPFVSKEMAYSNKVNTGRASLENNMFKFEIQMPNSFYKSLGTNFVPPMVNIRLCETVSNVNDYDSIQVSNGYPYKYLNHPANICTASNVEKQYKPSGPLFYTNRIFPLRGQEQILRESAMPKYNEMPSNFWGSKPSL